MLLILPIMLCSDSLPLALLCPKILPIMSHYALKMLDTNGHYKVSTVKPIKTNPLTSE